MKIGIFTFHRAYNCGAMLQAWALKTILERMGHSAVFPKCNRVGETPRWREWWNPSSRGLNRIRSMIYRALINLLSIPADGISQQRYKAFRRRYLPEVAFDPNGSLVQYDLLIFGSDQIWREEHYMENEKDIFFLRHGFGDGVKKITYAASCDDKPLTSSESAMLKNAVPRFDAVSVRERFLADQLASLTGRSCPIVLDPTLLLRDEDYRMLDCGCAPRCDYLFVYTLSANQFVVKTAREVAKRLGVKLILTPVYQYSTFQAPSGMTYGTSPERLVTYVAHAKYVMSYSFHGTVFSVIFQKRFLDLRPSIDTHETRSSSLLRQIGLTERMANPANSIEDIVSRLTAPFDENASKRLAVLREESLLWLENALKGVDK